MNNLFQKKIQLSETQPQKTHKTPKEWHQFRVRVATVVFILLINHIFSNFLFEISTPVILFLQTYDFFLFSFFFSYIIFYLPAYYVLISPLLLHDKQHAFYNLFLATMGNYFYGIFKLIYADWRPNFVNKSMISTKNFCDNEYGNPSGHSVGAFCFWYIFISDLCLFIVDEKQKKRVEYSLKAVSVVICLTRLYFGVHSIDQIIFGIGIGYLVFYIGEFFRESFSLLLFEEVFRTAKKKKLYLNSFFLIWASMSVVATAFFAYRFKVEQADEHYFDAIVNCLSVKNNPLRNFAVNVFEKTTVATVAVWAALGMRDRKQDVYIQLNSLKNSTQFVFIWRMILNVVPVLILMKFASIKITSFVPMVFKQIVIVPFLGYLYGRYYGVFSNRIWLIKEIKNE